MIRHIAMFRLKADAPAETPERLARALAELPGRIPQIATYAFGPDLALRPGTYDFAVVADFANVEDFRVYVDHPDHQAFIRDELTPVVAERVALQFEIA